MYLGEVTRNIIIALIDAAPAPLLFGGKSTSIINKHYGIDTSFMSSVEKAWLGDDSCVGNIKPPFTEVESGLLSAAEKKKLEQIRKVIVTDLITEDDRKRGFTDDQVSLKDAAVRPSNLRFPKARLSVVNRSSAGFVDLSAAGLRT